jgi:hypothetical protein
MIVGNTSGARKSDCSRTPTAPRRRARNSAASVPRIVAIVADASASSTLSANALRMFSSPKNSTNQRMENEGGGNWK